MSRVAYLRPADIVSRPLPCRLNDTNPLNTLQAEMAQADQAQLPDEPHHPVVVGLAHWLPQVGKACENPETDEAELDKLLSEATDALEGLREIALSTAAA